MKKRARFFRPFALFILKSSFGCNAVTGYINKRVGSNKLVIGSTDNTILTMEISVSEKKLSRKTQIINFIGDLIGATIALIFVPIIFLLSKLFPRTRKEREVKDINKIDLHWELIIENTFIKVYESYIDDWPKELEFIDFHQGDEFVKKFRTEPEIEELNNYYFGDFMPYDIENNFLEYDNGIFIIAYPTAKNEPDKFTLFHLDFESKQLTKIKENVLSLTEINYPNNYSIEIVSRDADRQETILVKKKSAL